MKEFNEVINYNSKINFNCMQNNFANKKQSKLSKFCLVLFSIIFFCLSYFLVISFNNVEKISSTQAVLGDIYTFSFKEFTVGVQDVQLEVNGVVQTDKTDADGNITLNNIEIGDVVSFSKEGYVFSKGGTDYIEEITITSKSFIYSFSAWQIRDAQQDYSFFYITMIYKGQYIQADASTQYFINGGTGQALNKMEIETSPSVYRLYARIDWAEADNEIVIKTSDYYFDKIILQENVYNYEFVAEPTYRYSFQMVDSTGNPLVNVQAYTQYGVDGELIEEGISSTQGILFVQGVRLGSTISFELLGYNFDDYSALQEVKTQIKRIGAFAEVDGVRIKFVNYLDEQIPICDETWAPIFSQLIFTRSDAMAVGELGTGENENYFMTQAKINDIFKFHLEGYNLEMVVLTRIPSDKMVSIMMRKVLEIKGTVLYPANESKEKINILVNGKIKTETDEAGQFALTDVLEGDEITFEAKNYKLKGFKATESEEAWTGSLEIKEKQYTALYIIFGSVLVLVLALPIFFARTRKKKKYLTEI